jgi:uncharacterized protein YndB with AHSA1/START domain
MAARNSAAARAAARELVLTRVFDAPPRLVFKAWTGALADSYGSLGWFMIGISLG